MCHIIAVSGLVLQVFLYYAFMRDNQSKAYVNTDNQSGGVGAFLALNLLYFAAIGRVAAELRRGVASGHTGKPLGPCVRLQPIHVLEHHGVA